MTTVGHKHSIQAELEPMGGGGGGTSYRYKP